MKICIFGAGAIGGYLAARLLAAGANVTVIARGATLQAIAAAGLCLREAGHEQWLRPTHLTDDAEGWATAGTRRPGECVVRKEPSRVARQAAALPGLPGVPLAAELIRVGIEAGTVGRTTAA